MTTMRAFREEPPEQGVRRRIQESDANALIKFVLTQLDEVAALPPAEACEPYALEERKRAIKRKVWEFHRSHGTER